MRIFCLAAALALSPLTVAPALAAHIAATHNWVYMPTSSLKLSDAFTRTVGRSLGHLVFAGGPLKTASIDCVSDDGSSPAGGHGQCVSTFADGDTLITTYECPDVVDPPEGGIWACKGSATVTGGTGKLAKASGSATFTQVVVGALPDGTAVGYSSLDWDLSY